MTKPTSKSLTVLEQLRVTYDTTQLLGWVDRWDQTGTALFDPDALRADMLRLHAMAHAVINGGPLSVASSPAAMGELATEISMEAAQLIALLETVRRIVQPLEHLARDHDSA
ncbi:MAG: transposase [Burkholderiaceae bacterium]|nr:hypothetical protein [Xanthomonadaceae bacterium]TAL63700.1 MAG: transposase [Burkholderiaceae bacterium]